MFGISFTELMIIGMVALIVIGPERLPRVARTLGHLVGRAQRYVNNVKSDIQREMDLSELKNVKTQMDEAVQSIKDSTHEVSQSVAEPFNDARKSLDQASLSLEEAIEEAEAQLNKPDSQNDDAASAPTSKTTDSSATSSAGTP